MLKYEKIADEIRQAIRKGQYSSGDQLPMEKDMCKQYQV
ncbi:MAG: GntR family transcriptional regulator, partial [Selenomonadaceae bacterium]|nr:GntR family transcriptional regulator [Selenomonadaceae bacterium]MBR6342743.1 GntR family transcriptional regulator [Selenomonadaceae bacterium]